MQNSNIITLNFDSLPSNVLFITAWVKYYSTFELSNKKHTETTSKKLNLVHFNHKNQIEKKILLTEILAECKKYDKKNHFYMVTIATKLIILVYMYLYFYNDCLEVKLH